MDALRDNKWPKLSEGLANARMLHAVIEVLEEGAGASVIELKVSGNVASLNELGRVLQEGACPMLTALMVVRMWPLAEKERCIENMRVLLRDRHIVVKSLS